MSRRPALWLTLAFSSTATALALLAERGETATETGRVAIAVLIFQDLAVVPLLALLPLLAGSGDLTIPAVGIAVGKAVVAMLAIFLFGHFLVRPAYRFVAAARSPEVFTAANILLVIGVGSATVYAGMSMALGAFLAGLLLAESPLHKRVEANIAPFRGLLLGLFFMTVGMSINLPYVAAHWPVLLGLAALFITVKAVLLVGLGMLMHIPISICVYVGLLLSQVGEFAFIILGKASAIQLFSEDVTQAITASAVITMVVTPLLAVVGRRLALWLQPLPSAQKVATTVL